MSTVFNRGAWWVVCNALKCRAGQIIDDPNHPFEDHRTRRWTGVGNQHWCPHHESCDGAVLARFDRDARAAANAVYPTGYSTGAVIFTATTGFALVAAHPTQAALVIRWPTDAAAFVGEARWKAVRRLAALASSATDDAAALMARLCPPQKTTRPARSTEVKCVCGVVLRSRRGMNSHEEGRAHKDRMRKCDYCSVLKRDADGEPFHTTSSGVEVCDSCAKADPERLADSLLVPERGQERVPLERKRYVPVVGAGRTT